MLPRAMHQPLILYRLGSCLPCGRSALSRWHCNAGTWLIHQGVLLAAVPFSISSWIGKCSLSRLDCVHAEHRNRSCFFREDSAFKADLLLSAYCAGIYMWWFLLGWSLQHLQWSGTACLSLLQWPSSPVAQLKPLVLPEGHKNYKTLLPAHCTVTNLHFCFAGPVSLWKRNVYMVCKWLLF